MSQQFHLPGFDDSLGPGSSNLGTWAKSNDSIMFMGERRVSEAETSSFQQHLVGPSQETSAGPADPIQDTLMPSYCGAFTREPEQDDEPEWGLFLGFFDEDVNKSTLRIKPEYMRKFDNPLDPWMSNTAAATASTSAPEPGISANNAHAKFMENNCNGFKKLSLESSKTPATPFSQPKRTKPRLAFVLCKKCHRWRPKCKPHVECEPSEQPSSTPMDDEPTRRQPAPASLWVLKRRREKKRMRLIDDFRKRPGDE
ncbi:hypothetical protein FHETE_1836 [Fusarium heterosporum]|uniref:Uncharacterized protein n=1 Tax=Fusarium heterosporum TaxID=42747 RepID=A0A8H5TY79_FUSHE|nr:hypothetical protein FHETE_1836 [Fusarium heterosporum]